MRLPENRKWAEAHPDVLAQASASFDTMHERPGTIDFLVQGLQGDFLGLVKTHSSAALKPVLKGEDAFKLYDTFGLPLDFMIDAARDRGITFDQSGFDAAMEDQRKRAQASWKGGSKKSASLSDVRGWACRRII